MLEILSVILFCWLFFKTLGLAFRAAWGTAKMIASVLFVLAVPMLVISLLFAGGILLCSPFHTGKRIQSGDRIPLHRLRLPAESCCWCLWHWWDWLSDC